MVSNIRFFTFFGGPGCIGNSFAYVAHFVFLRDVWIRIKSAAVASRRATNLATHPHAQPAISLLSHPSPFFATALPT
jgi:hypothetical protein